MMCFSILAVSMFLGQNAPGPSDAYELNMTQVSARADYVLSRGTSDYSRLVNERMWNGGASARSFETDNRSRGHWASDGTTERFQFEIRVAPTPGQKEGTTRELEAIYDGHVFASRVLGKQQIHASSTGIDAYLSAFCGPFLLFNRPLQYLLDTQFPKIRPRVKQGVVAKYPVEVEIYRRDYNDAWNQLEISFDPALNYVPRYARMVTYMSKYDKAIVIEHFLIAMHHSSNGGIVPAEWIETYKSIPNFMSHYPSYTEDTKPDIQGEVSYVSFRASEFKNVSSPVGLHREGAAVINSPGGLTALPRSASAGAVITMDDITKIAGNRLFKRYLPPPMPTLDREELAKFASKPSSFWALALPLVVIVVAAAVALLIFRRARHGSFIGVLLIVMPLSGCGTKANVARTAIYAAFDEPRVLYNPNDPAGTFLTLAITSRGDQPIEIQSIDGGCTCREIDHTKLPATLQPGETKRFSVRFRDNRSYTLKGINFTLNTDRGELRVTPTLFALPRFGISPDSLSNLLDEDDKWSFDVTFREVFRASEVSHPTDVIKPDGFSLSKVDSRSGPIEGATEFSFRDTVYKLTLEDRTFGAHKGSITFNDKLNGETVASGPILWERRTFISAVPARVVLGPRPVRVFLRCRDEEVELTKVLSTPRGVLAVVSSPREVSVRLAPDAAPIIDGVIEVATTAAEPRAPLNIPVVRYQPNVGAPTGK
jgi:hypothetical protein